MFPTSARGCLGRAALLPWCSDTKPALEIIDTSSILPSALPIPFHIQGIFSIFLQCWVWALKTHFAFDLRAGGVQCSVLLLMAPIATSFIPCHSLLADFPHPGPSWQQSDFLQRHKPSASHKTSKFPLVPTSFPQKPTPHRTPKAAGSSCSPPVPPELQDQGSTGALKLHLVRAQRHPWNCCCTALGLGVLILTNY